MIPKRSLLKLHRRLAMVLAVFILVQAITGMAISWRWDVARFLDPVGMSGRPSSAAIDTEQVLAHVSEQLPLGSGWRVFFPVGENGVYLFRLETEGGTHYASVDPADGKILRQGSVWRFPVEAALRLHFQPLQGWPGNLPGLSLGLGLTIMIITGFLFWRPRAGRWLPQLAVDRKLPSKIVVRKLHRTMGILALPLLLTIAVTGSILAAELLVQNSSAQAARPLYSTPDFTGLNKAIATASQEFPGNQVRDVRVLDRGSLSLQLWQPGEDAWTIHRVTTGPRGVGIAERLAAEERRELWPTVLPIHTGSVGGIAGRTLVVATAMVLLSLALIGLYLLLARRNKPGSR